MRRFTFSSRAKRNADILVTHTFTVDEQTIIAELDVISEHVVLGPTLAQDMDVTVHAERLPVTHDGTTWFHVTVVTTDFSAFERALEADPTVADAEVFAAYEGRRTYRLTIAPEVPIMTNHVASFGDELIDLKSIGDGWRVRIRTTDRESVRQFWAFCDERNIDCHLERVFRSDRPVGEWTVSLDDEAVTLLQTAHEAGYFDVPRSVTLTELADRFDVAESTLSVRLRRALDRLLSDVLPDPTNADD